MIEKLEKEIDLTNELLNGLPVNNRKNKERFLEEISIEISNYQKKVDEVTAELKSRLVDFDNLKYEEVKDNSAALKKLLNALSYTSTISTPFEKLNLDKIVYQLSTYEGEELIGTNKKILDALNIFKASNMPLRLDDFNYSIEVKDYMKMFFEEELTNAKIKETFDRIYWKCPDIITRIELNLRHLYIKYEPKGKKYIENLNKNIKENFAKAETSLMDDYNYLRKQINPYSSKTNLILDIYSQKLDISNYTDESIKEITSKLFINNDYDDSKIDLIRQLIYSLKEYKNYLKYKELIDKARNLYKDNIEKDYMKKTLKKISALESKLFKLNKKSSGIISRTSVDKLEPEINAKISEIKALYDEIDTNLFKVLIKEHIKDNSTLFKVFLLITDHYKISADYFKEKMEKIDYNIIDKEIDALKEFVMDPNNTLINNITILDETDLSQIILTNYKLLNMNIEESLANEDAIESLISDLEKIIINHTMKQMNIDIKRLEDTKAIKALEL